MLAFVASAREPEASSHAPAYVLEESPLIGGVRQRLILRGPGTSHPVVLLVHGGPGTNEGPLFRQFVPGLERHFLMVYWEQRGTGRSYASGIPAASMTIDRFTRDIGEVIGHLRSRIAAPRVILLAHSWGTIPAALYALQHPDDIEAYIGVGQHYDVPRSEWQAWHWALEEARRQGHRRAMERLDDIGPPPHTVDEMLQVRGWVERFGGTFRGRMRTRDLIATALADPDTNVLDLWRFGRGNAFSLEHLWPEIRHVDFKGRDAWQVPVLFVIGRHDRVVSASLSKRYFDSIRAPCKKVAWFDDSAHNPPFEEPAKFERTLAAVPSWLKTCPSR